MCADQSLSAGIGYPGDATLRIAVVVVTLDRPHDLGLLLQSLRDQSRQADFVLVIDNGGMPETAAVVAQHPGVRRIACTRNLGGAGGFALGILTALSEGATHVWLMDDDGLPEGADCLSVLLSRSTRLEADVTSPVVVDINDRDVLAFPYPIRSRRTMLRRDLDGSGVIEHFAHLFNGALIRDEAFARYGIPDYRLFLRGDEIDFLHRVRRSGGLIVTIPEVAFRHPSGMPETFPILRGYLNAVVPQGALKQHCFFRNRGYLLRRHKLVCHALTDILRYPWYFLAHRRGDWRGLGCWLGLMRRGWREDFRPYEPPVSRLPATPQTEGRPVPLVE
ncbi:glycosyltransferase family 2 protein [Roseomonas xinghualingensis]|uniref:glycosyltransferase family 2 protein n=1 Tax=Roseomonas xinghualingensis TaxID=2986475 RepID=UPI0021F1BE8A|nr:glycosyltransferase [Roseomonas sp. SXEYE001]MCV4210318.1 glycosyltransferase [Roseomonas sp. SXEYE001]